MSRIGKQPIPVPSGVDVAVEGAVVRVKGAHGELSLDYHPNMSVEVDGDAKEVRVVRPDDSRQNRALHGLTRSLINNMVAGVIEPFVKQLDIHGVGYQAIIEGNVLNLHVGFANTIRLPIPAGITCEVNQQNRIKVQGCDKQMVGQFAANIRKVRPPEPYKGKGIRYVDEFVRRKQGKAFVGADG
jgi:large subunit ribosomal protein L6